MILDDRHGSRFNLHFFHGQDIKTGRRFTTATLHLGPCAHKARPCGTMDAVVGTAVCSENDQFVYTLGRLQALTRAFELANLSKEQKSELWRSYFAKWPSNLPTPGMRATAAAKARKIEQAKETRRAHKEFRVRSLAKLMQAITLLVEEEEITRP